MCTDKLVEQLVVEIRFFYFSEVLALLLLDLLALKDLQQMLGNQTLFMTYKTPAEAKVAFNRLNNLKFDKNHTLQCISIGELRNIIEES